MQIQLLLLNFSTPYLNLEVLVVPGGEELVDEEGPGHQDKEQRVPELGLGIHLQPKKALLV